MSSSKFCAHGRDETHACNTPDSPVRNQAARATPKRREFELRRTFCRQALSSGLMLLRASWNDVNSSLPCASYVDVLSERYKAGVAVRAGMSEPVMTF